MTTKVELPEPNEREKRFFEGLQAPVHPGYDFDVEPADQMEYANPVTLNNKLVLYSNALIEITKNVVAIARQRERLRLEKKDVERELKTLRNGVLSRNPAPPSAAKNLALTEAYVVRCLEAENLLKGAQVLEEKIAQLEDKVEWLKEEGENLRYTAHTIKLASDNITVHLSFVKAEQKNLHRTGI